MFNRASMKLGLEQAVLGDAAGSLKPRDMEDLLKKGAYALTQMDEVDAMRCVRGQRKEPETTINGGSFRKL